MNMNIQFGGGAAFFGMAHFQNATQTIQQAPMQQIQQLQSLMQTAFQSFFQMGNQFGLSGQGFAQSPAAMPGYVMPPNNAAMFPSNPASLGGGFAFGGGFAIGGSGMIGTPMPPEKTGLIQSNQNPPEFTTPGGFKVKAEGKDAGWTITSPEGKTTRIWGDPHVDGPNGGRWDFKKDMSFVLPDGTKITAKTTPPLSSGYTVTDSIDIMHGNQRATISGIHNNKVASEGVKNDRWAVDARTPDGDYAVLGGKNDAWYLNGKNEIIGSEKQGEILKTRQGQPTGITGQAMNAMQEQMPRYGGQEFMVQLLQQMMQQIMSRMQQFLPQGGMF